MTVAQLIESVRYRIRDTDATNFGDDELIVYLNELLNGCYSTMQNVESILIVEEATIPLLEGQACYDVPFEHNGFLDDGLWIEGKTTYLKRTTRDRVGPYLDSGSPSIGAPLWYYMNDDQLCLYPAPREDGILHVTFWVPWPGVSNTSQEIPWGGLWDKYLVKAVVVECLERQERDVTQAATQVWGMFNEAITQVMNRGVRPRRLVSDMFTARGC